MDEFRGPTAGIVGRHVTKLGPDGQIKCEGLVMAAQPDRLNAPTTPQVGTGVWRLLVADTHGELIVVTVGDGTGVVTLLPVE